MLEVLLNSLLVSDEKFGLISCKVINQLVVDTSAAVELFILHKLIRVIL